MVQIRGIKICIIKSYHLPSDFLLVIYRCGQVCHATPFPESARTVESAARKKKKTQPAPLKGSFHGSQPLHFSHSSNGRREIIKKWSETRSPKNAQDVRADIKGHRILTVRLKSSEWPSQTSKDFGDV